MTTFSQLVDSIVFETKRPDLLMEIGSYLNQTIRELHFVPDLGTYNAAKGNAVFFAENLRESLLVANVDTGFGWDIPDVSVFQAMRAVRFDTQTGVYPPEQVPGRGLASLRAFYYRAASRYYFSGYGGLNALISLAWYQFPNRLKYFPVSQRPAVWDVNDGWTYAPAFSGTAELHVAAQAYTTNWILQRWEDVIAEGLRAKVYKRVSDDNRAKTCYSMYSTLRQGLVSSESADLGGYA